MELDGEGLMRRGVLIRHLMIPGLLFDSKKIIDWIYNQFGDSVYISLMNQYTPMHQAGRFREIKPGVKPPAL
ncbi:MAG: hypothetical protein M1609_05485 [Firmicutes bacterium]|nr:hypothetical protein [Bacillota bacterium]